MSCSCELRFVVDLLAAVQLSSRFCWFCVRGCRCYCGRGRFPLRRTSRKRLSPGVARWGLREHALIRVEGGKQFENNEILRFIIASISTHCEWFWAAIVTGFGIEHALNDRAGSCSSCSACAQGKSAEGAERWHFWSDKQQDKMAQTGIEDTCPNDQIRCLCAETVTLRCEKGHQTALA